LSPELFPFTAVVRQERLKRALLLNAVNPAVGGVLVKGPSGTGKSTAVRGLAALLPEIDVVADCPFSCDPDRPGCESCRSRSDLPRIRRRRRIVDLPLNATEDRVAGTVDIARALREGERALEPGLLAEANRGILYVDEINLLDDHLVDLLLDAAALGVNVVEREGVSLAHPARFLLVGTMNEEEGELRPQIADRLGLQVEVEPIGEPKARAEVMRRREAFTRDPALLMAQYDLKSFLGNERLEFLVKDLKEAANQEKNEPRQVFLLSYIMYNTGNERMASAYLDLAEKRAAKPDPLYQMLRKYWALPSDAPPVEGANK
jgi:magnesium chelatase subunit I